MLKSLLIFSLIYFIHFGDLKSQKVIDELSIYNQFKLRFEKDTLKLSIYYYDDSITLKSKTTFDSILITPIAKTDLETPSLSQNDIMFEVFGYKNGAVVIMLWYTVDGPFLKYYEILNNKVIAQANYEESGQWITQSSKTSDTIISNEYDAYEIFDENDGGIIRENILNRETYFGEIQNFSYVSKQTKIFGNKKEEYHFEENGDTIFASIKTYTKSKNIFKKANGKRNNGYWTNVINTGYLKRFHKKHPFKIPVDTIIVINKKTSEFFENRARFCDGDYLYSLSPFIKIPDLKKDNDLLINKSLLQFLWNNSWSRKALASFEEYVANKKKSKYFILEKN
jgi:hypothetical protein